MHSLCPPPMGAPIDSLPGNQKACSLAQLHRCHTVLQASDENVLDDL